MKMLWIIRSAAVLVVLVGASYLYFHTGSTATAPRVTAVDQCNAYRTSADIVGNLRKAGTKVPIMLPSRSLQDYFGGKSYPLYVGYGADTGGEYHISMSLDYRKDGTYDCQWSDSNYEGSFTASLVAPQFFEENKSDGKEVLLSKGITGYFYESGRGDSNIEWEYQNVFYQMSDIDVSETDAVMLTNSAIENAQ